MYKPETQKLTDYTLAETGTDTGIFSGEVILKGLRSYNADGDADNWYSNGSGNDITSISQQPAGSGPTDGTFKATETMMDLQSHTSLTKMR